MKVKNYTRGPYLTTEQSDALYNRLISERLTIGKLAEELERDRAALYRLFNRRYGYRAGHAVGSAWSKTIKLPNDVAIHAYIAGLVDGEGSIIKSKQYDIPHYSVTMSLTDEPCIRWVAQFVGTVSSYRPKGNRKRCYKWSVARKYDVVELLKAILPYLIIKKEKAILAIEALEKELSEASAIRPNQITPMKR